MSLATKSWMPQSQHAFECIQLHAHLQAEVSNEDAEALTRQLRLRFYRTCVKDNLNVSEGEIQLLPEPLFVLGLYLT